MNDTLPIFLEFHVPLQLMDLRRRRIQPFSEEYNDELKQCSQVVSEKGDTILYKTNESGKNVTALSKAIALLLLAGHEVEVFGVKFSPV